MIPQWVVRKCDDGDVYGAPAKFNKLINTNVNCALFQNQLTANNAMTLVQTYLDTESYVTAHVRVYDVVNNAVRINAEWSPVVRMVCIGYNK